MLLGCGKVARQIFGGQAFPTTSCFYLKLLSVVVKIFDIPIAPGVVQWIVPDSEFQESYLTACAVLQLSDSVCIYIYI